MADHSEQIEAKLAAYIDGELAGGDREEIEQHLAANPSHLALVADLMWHKQLIRGLPRELAPINMNEDLQSQLERDVLLSGPDPAEEARAVAGRIHRWPQIFSAAAILALTAGLAAVVYSVLPGKRPTEIALDRQTAPVIKPDARGAGGQAGGSGGAPALAMRGADQPRLVDGTPPTFAAGRGSAGKSAGDADEAMVTVSEPETLVLAVSGDDLNVARGQVVSYLTANQLAYRAAGEGGSSLVRLANDMGMEAFDRTAGEVLAQSTVLFRRYAEADALNAPIESAQEPRLTQRRDGELALDPAIREAARAMEEKEGEVVLAKGGAAQPAPAAAAADLGQSGAEQAKQMQGTPPDTVAQADRRSRSIRPAPPAPEAPAQNAALPLPAATPPAPGKAADERDFVAGGNAGGRDSLTVEAQRFAREQSIQLDTTQAAGGPAARVIVVRNINGRQVRELAARLKQAQVDDSVAAKAAITDWQVTLFTPDQQRKLLGEQQAVALAEQVVRTADMLESQELAAWTRREAEQRERLMRDRARGQSSDMALRSNTVGGGTDGAPATQPALPDSEAAPADRARPRDLADVLPPVRGAINPATRPVNPELALQASATRPTLVAGATEQLHEQVLGQSTASGFFAINGTVPANERAYFNCVIVLHNPAEVLGAVGATAAPATQPAARSAPEALTRPAR